MSYPNEAATPSAPGEKNPWLAFGLEMLGIMADRLPEMEQAVNSTSESLEKRLRKELGRKKTPWSLQELILGEQTGQAEDQSNLTFGASFCTSGTWKYSAASTPAMAAISFRVNARGHLSIQP